MDAALADVTAHHGDGGPLLARARRGVASLRDEAQVPPLLHLKDAVEIPLNFRDAVEIPIAF